MTKTEINNALLSALGFVAGFGSAFLGIGGGVIMVPILALFFRYDMKKAIGTSLATIVPAALVGVITHFIIQSNNIRLMGALVIIVGSIVGAKGGAVLANKIHSKVLTVLFAALLLFIGLRQTGVIGPFINETSSGGVSPYLIVLGLAAGLCSALFGIGGGVVMVPALNLVFGFSMHAAIATSLTVIVPTSLAGALFHAGFNNVEKSAVKLLVPTALIGAVLGAILSNALSGDILRLIFGVVLIILSARMFLHD